MTGKSPNVVFGCGYLGRRVARRWVAARREVIAVTRSASRAAELRSDGMIPDVGDICDPDWRPNLPPQLDTVLFAVGYDRSSGRTQEEVFVGGLRNVLSRVGANVRRWIQISSTSVYGQADGSWVDETSPCEPVQPGGLCCLAAERAVQEHVRATGTSAVVLRLGGIYGPGRLLSRVAELKAGSPLPGVPESWLNLIHVEDAAEAVAAAASHGSPPPVVVVVDDRPVERGEYYARLAELVGAPRPVFDRSRERGRGAGGLNKRCSNRRMKGELGVVLRYPTFEEGLAAAWRGEEGGRDGEPGTAPSGRA